MNRLWQNWTAEEDLELTQRAARHEGKAAIAAAMGRGVGSVTYRLKELGLTTQLWTAAEEEFLRQNYGAMPSREIARRLNRPKGSVKQHARKIGLYSGRRFTDEQIAMIRELWPTHTGKQVAEMLPGRKRNWQSIARMAAALGLRKIANHASQTLASIQELHAQGLPDREIAQRLGLDREQVKHIRVARLKLPTNPDLDARRRSIASQRKTLGIKSSGELRALAYRRFAVENGWPPDLRAREVQILNVLADRGVPMTRLELAAAIGMRTDRVGCNHSLALLIDGGRDGTYTASLLRQGYLARVRRAARVEGKGKGKSRDLYFLGPVAITILEERACQQQQAETAS